METAAINNVSTSTSLDNNSTDEDKERFLRGIHDNYKQTVDKTNEEIAKIEKE